MDENLHNRPKRYTRREDYSEMLLAQDGVCRCVAVIGAEVSEKVRAAAEDFCDLLQRNKFITAVEGKADHHPKGIPPFC